MTDGGRGEGLVVGHKPPAAPQPGERALGDPAPADELEATLVVSPYDDLQLNRQPGDGGTQMLQRLVGRPLAMKMVLAGTPIRAAEALTAGLVTEPVPAAETIARALELADLIAEKSPLALRLAKAAVRAAYELPLAEGLALERRGYAQLCGTADTQEGVAAFLEKRKPRFVGR